MRPAPTHALPLLALLLAAACASCSAAAPEASGRIWPQPANDWTCKARGWTPVEVDARGGTDDADLGLALGDAIDAINNMDLGGACLVVGKPDRHPELERACFKARNGRV